MKATSAILFTLLLLSSMVGLGYLSGAWGYKLGREALESITQPDSRPTNGMARRNAAGSQPNETTFLKEADILAEVQARMEGRVGPISQRQANAAAPAAIANNPEVQPVVDRADNTPLAIAGLPLSTTDQGVSLEIQSVHRQGAMMVLAVQLQNDSPQPVEFLYSFMTVRDETGRALSASTDGLPTEIAANGGYGVGEIRVPAELVGDSATISLSLSDYPDQRLQLGITEIPMRP